jgi:hypothetical protein
MSRGPAACGKAKQALVPPGRRQVASDTAQGSTARACTGGAGRVVGCVFYLRLFPDTKQAGRGPPFPHGDGVQNSSSPKAQGIGGGVCCTWGAQRGSPGHKQLRLEPGRLGPHSKDPGTWRSQGLPRVRTGVGWSAPNSYGVCFRTPREASGEPGAGRVDRQRPAACTSGWRLCGGHSLTEPAAGVPHAATSVPPSASPGGPGSLPLGPSLTPCPRTSPDE